MLLIAVQLACCFVPNMRASSKLQWFGCGMQAPARACLNGPGTAAVGSLHCLQTAEPLLHRPAVFHDCLPRCRWFLVFPGLPPGRGEGFVVWRGLSGLSGLLVRVPLDMYKWQVTAVTPLSASLAASLISQMPVRACARRASSTLADDTRSDGFLPAGPPRCSRHHGRCGRLTRALPHVCHAVHAGRAPSSGMPAFMLFWLFNSISNICDPLQ